MAGSRFGSHSEHWSIAVLMHFAQFLAKSAARRRVLNLDHFDLAKHGDILPHPMESPARSYIACSSRLPCDVVCDDQQDEQLRLGNHYFIPHPSSFILTMLGLSGAL